MLEQIRFHQAAFALSFGQLDLKGSDVEVFLQRQSTFNISTLHENEFHLASFLDPHGKTEFYCWILKSSGSFVLLIPLTLREIAMARLQKFLISEDVEIEDLGIRTWTIRIGPDVSVTGIRGEMLEENAVFIPGTESNTSDKMELELLRKLNGWPSFDGQDFKPELINNLRLYDLSVSENKGCYPGQETVSKIATRRGAAYSPVLIEVVSHLNGGTIHSHDKKIGEAETTLRWDSIYFLPASLLRDFRVEGMRLGFTLNGESFTGTVRYYPLFSADVKSKAQELFYQASNKFRHGLDLESEQLFRDSIRIDPTFADSYEALGVLLGRQERFAEALEVMKSLSEVDPLSVMAHTNMSLYLMRLGKIEEAEEQKSQATLKSFQKLGAEAKEKAKVQEDKKAKESEWVKRESMFQQVLEIDSEDALANYGLGSIAVERGNWEVAISHLRKVLTTDPNYSVAYLSLGKAYSELGKTEDARETWKKGILVAAGRGDLMPANQMQVELDRL